MNQFVELEISLERIEETVHVRLDFDRPDSAAKMPASSGIAKFDFEALRAAAGNRAQYGSLLSQSLFSDPKIREHFAQGRAVAQSLKQPLRLRIAIDKSAGNLHRLIWEALCDADTDEVLAMREDVLFSRYISREDWSPITLRAKNEMRALVAIASPANAAAYRLAPVDVPGETQRALAGLGSSIPATVLGGGGGATLENIIGKLREGFDILLLVCHGALIDGEPVLYLESEAGDVKVEHGVDFATRLSQMKQSPRLVVLASCESAGTGAEPASADEGVLAALGPRLAQAGIPAVIAMQGSVTMKTAGAFLPVFFQEMQKDGQLDHAMAVARGAVRSRPDWWMPVLFMSLKQGRIFWYTPGFTGFRRWPSLVNSIRNGECTPILGSGLLESLVGSFPDIARDWAKKHDYPMAGEECAELPLVAQYLEIDQGEPTFVRDEFRKSLKAGVRSHYPELDALPELAAPAPVEAWISAAGKIRRDKEPDEPHRILASLPLRLYLTTNPDNLLADALVAANKKPVIGLFPQRGATDSQTPQDFDPTPETPLVYHLFGHLRDRRSVRLTQDDYLNYLIDVTRNNDLIPLPVRNGLTSTALLFLGFQLTDWDFRVLFLQIMSREGRARLQDFAHVAVQIDPEQNQTIDPDRAMRYLEQYFGGAKDGPQFAIYWGSAESFLKELKQHMQSEP